MTRYVVLDTETTGFSPVQDRIVWIAAAVVESDGTVSERWSIVINPQAGQRTRVNGLSLADQPAFRDIAPRLSALLKDGVLVAHNATFDQAFLAAEFERAGLVMPDVPAICTMRLTQRLGLEVASFSLVDCCGHFGISHARRHHAVDDVEATVQLLARLLPLASARGWTDLESLRQALALDRDDGELSYTIDVDQILVELLVEKAGWRPGEEPIEAAWERYGATVRAERDAAYAAMQPEHRAAHQQLDALDFEETRARQWFPVLDALEAAGCPEAPDIWVKYAMRLQGPKRNAKRALQALHRALELRFAESQPSRTAVDEAVMWLHIVCNDAGLVDELLDAYQRWGPQLAQLPPCGSCGDQESGCRAGLGCAAASLAQSVAFAISSGLTDDDNTLSDPGRVEARTRLALPLLAAEPDLWPYVHLGCWFGRLLVSWHRPDDAQEMWQRIVERTAGHTVRRLPTEADNLAGAFAKSKDYKRAIMVTTSALDIAHRSNLDQADRWRIADHLGTYLERDGQLAAAKAVWFTAIVAGSNVANTFDRLSLSLEREAQYATAAEVCEQGWSRFPRDVRGFKYALRIKERGERCRTQAALGPTAG